MKRIEIGALALLILLLVAGLLRTMQPARAQDEPAKAWVEGSVVTEDDKRVIGWHVSFTIDGKSIADADCNMSMNGFYQVRDLRPGTYEMIVGNSIFAATQGYKTIRIFGIVVKPGVRNVLNFTLHEGKGIEEIGQPVVATQKVIILSQELEQLQKQIDALKK